MDEIFTKSIRLLKDIIFTDVVRLDSFLHIKGVFTDSWYNFVVPIVGVEDFSWDEAEKLIKSEKREGYELSYYIAEKYLDEYQPVLKDKELTKLGDDNYMTYSMKGKFESVSGKFVEVDEGNFSEYAEMAVGVFDDWSGEREYCEHFYKLKRKNKDSDKIISNLMLVVDGKCVSFISIYGSKRQKLAYLHNAGTKDSHRRRGYFTRLVKHSCNLAFDKGVKSIYSLVEEGKGSFYGLSKLGFAPACKFFLYS